MVHPPVSHHDNHDHVHLPPPSYWPVTLAFAFMFVPFGFLMTVWSLKGGTAILVLGSLGTVIGLMGWANSIIRETVDLPNVEEDGMWLKKGLLFFLASEAAIFGAFFVHHYYSRWHAADWPPAGAPHLETSLPAIATLILMASSATMEWAHAFMRRGQRKLASWLTLVTILLGVVFLGFQGHEWGFLKTYDNFTMTSGTFGTTFYAMTGFHGLHVAIGVVMLAIVWLRLRLGHFEPRRHFSFLAASWYWHFVDLIWVLLFFTIYLL